MIRAGGALVLVGLGLALVAGLLGARPWAYVGLMETAGIILMVVGVVWRKG